MKIKPIIQTERSECGLACLAMVAASFGARHDLAELRKRFSVSLRGTGLAALASQAQRLGLLARPVCLELEDLAHLRLPSILHWDFNHFVVLARVRQGRLTLLDPAVGERVMTLSAASPHFTGVAMELSPAATFRPADQRRRLRLRDLTGRIVGLKRALLNVFLLALAIEAVALLSPLVTQWVVDGALVSADRDLLLLAVLGGALLTFTDAVLRMSRGWIGLRLNQQVSLQWTANLFAHLMRLPLSFFEKRHLGDITGRFSSLAAIRNVLTTGAISALLDGGMAVVTFVLMFIYSARLAAVALAAVALYGALRWVAYRPFRDASEERIVLSAKEQSHFLETLRAVQPLKLGNALPQRLSHWQNLLADVQNRDTATQKMSLAFATANTFIFGIEGMLLLYFGGSAVLDGALTLGMLLAFLSYKAQFGGRASKLIDLGIEVRMLSLHAERLADIALEAPEAQAPQDVDVARLQATLEFKDVSFRYGESDPWVLRHVTLRIEAGQSVAIVGPSGCGKTTLLKLGLGLLEPTEGEVCIGNLPLRQLGLDGVRRLFAAVMQDDHLLAGSLAENIAGFEAGASDERIEKAARQAHVHGDIARMPMGYQTVIADMGSSLSGGQKQRVLLARALYREPRMLALDEATSHLDAHNERHVIQVVAGLPLTRITIAHRPETVAAADRVVVLHQGGIVQDLPQLRPDMPQALSAPADGLSHGPSIPSSQPGDEPTDP